MKRIVLLILLASLSFNLISSPVTFSGGYSKVSLKEGRKTVSLTEGATVTAEGMKITASTITLQGDDYSQVECSGKITIEDKEKGLLIKTSNLYYDRSGERLIISTWCEVSDSINELEASSFAVNYDLKEEILSLEMSARLLKNTDSGILSARAEKITFNRKTNTLILAGNASVNWNNNNYQAALISIDIDTQEINLEGKIQGEVNG
ncbi:MAG: LptA/OstA family protein [Spirochaetales bacterium]|uniref:LptA/OstA family protein n=1 Tax=Bullifex sp. TaxID=2815808 RepID=UPI002A56A603|nr:LptA/OstA family protein [Bullifex sp.]MDD5972474.1 LptA/OstA family protein [Spirochaetales bacterium]MDD7271864.1 LptA/OstA family protein [Spirochaetales bacterium]MDY4066982.1 LptA/OstA family protein [Bullifex sp.]